MILRTILELGAVVGESVLPTHQCFPQWLLVDLECIGTFERIIEVLLPRISHLGMVGTVFNMFYITPPPLQATFVVLGYIASTITGLAIICSESMTLGNGESLDDIYFVLPIIIQSVAIITLVVATVLSTYNKSAPSWEGVCGVKMIHASLHHAMCLKLVPPFWFNVAIVLDETEERTNHIVEVGNAWVQWSETIPEVANTFVVLATEGQVRHFSVPFVEMAEGREAEMSICSSMLLAIRRIPRDENKSEDFFDAGSFIDAVDIVG